MDEDPSKQLHRELAGRAPRILGFDREAYFPEWQSGVRRSFKQLLGVMPTRAEGAVEVEIASDVRTAGADGLGEREVVFFVASEKGVRVRCRMAAPMGGRERVPLVICVGDSRGSVLMRSARARGYGVLVMALRGSVGDERERSHAALASLLVGRTMMGERVWDVSRVVDALVEQFAEVVDGERIFVAGSGAEGVGGATAFYAGAFEPRIAGVVAVGGVGAYAESLARVGSEASLYLPNVMHYLEMADVAGLIVPRGLVVAGSSGAGVEECFGEIAEIYALQGAGGRCARVMGDEERVWAAFEKSCGGAG